MLEPFFPADLSLALLLVAGDLVTAGAAWRLFGRRAPERSALREFVVGTALVATACVVVGAFSHLLFRNPFALMRVASHLPFVVGVPLALWRGLRRGCTAGGFALTAFGLVNLIVLAQAHFIEPYRVEFTRYSIDLPAGALPEQRTPLKVAVLADLQTDRVGSYEREVLARVAAERPDLVLLPGDFVQLREPRRFEIERDSLVALLELIDPPLGSYAVMGDVDFHSDIFSGSTIQLLDDETVQIAGVPGLQVRGLSLDRSRQKLRTADLPPSPPGTYTLLMGHAPDAAIPLLDGTVSAPLVYVAGHTHGGQVVVPGYGPPITLSAVPREVAAGGLFGPGPAHVLVSRGVGHERGHAPRIRLFCRPEVVLLTLHAASARGN